MKKLLISFFLLYGVVYGQTSTHEKPVSLIIDIPPISINKNTQKIMPCLDMDSIEKEREEDGVFRFGYIHEVSLNLNNCGEWIALPGGDKIWRLQIYCPNAISINLLYDSFWIPEGAKFFIYSNDYQYQLGAFTSKNNRGKKEDNEGFATGLIHSDNITMEYLVPKELEDVGIISICNVVHGYKNIDFTDNSDRGFGDSWKKGTNINCPSGAAWQKEKNAVVRVLSVNGFFTGSLVNTTADANNNLHYILTAAHCLDNNIRNWLFYWHYESPGCSNPVNEPFRVPTNGATAVACHVGYNSVDFALVELDVDPKEEWDIIPYYLGWDNSNNQTSCTIIHHPKGDIKKITSCGPFETNYPYCPLYSWRFSHAPVTDTILQGGSSGAPLLNPNHKLIGHHCKMTKMSQYPGNGLYWQYDNGKFSVAWEGMNPNTSNSTNRLKDWLDPLNKNVTTWDGRSVCQQTIKLHYLYPQLLYHAVQKIISKQEIPTDVTTTYKAGEEIVLEDGFHAQAGSNFHAKIEEYTECITPPRSNSPSQNNNQNEELIDQESKFQSIHNQFIYEFNLLPNPNSGTFQIETNFPLSDLSHLKITNTLGVTVYETKNLASNEIQLPNSVSGLYFVVMVLKDGTVLTQKMMVQR